MSPRQSEGGPGDGPPEPTTFEQAYRQCKRLVFYAIGDRVDAATVEDVCHQVFLRLHKRILENHGAMPRRVRTVLLGFVEDEIKNARRSVKRRRVDGEPDLEAMPASGPDPEQRLGRLETAKDAMTAISAQMKKEAVDLLLLAELGMSHEELAEQRGTTAENIAVQLSRARAKFREIGAPIYDLMYGSRRES